MKLFSCEIVEGRAHTRLAGVAQRFPETKFFFGWFFASPNV